MELAWSLVKIVIKQNALFSFEEIARFGPSKKEKAASA